MKIWDEELEALRQKGRYRSLKTVSSKRGTGVVVNGRRLINFSSNNYLGLAQHPEVKHAARQAIRKFGTGAEASRLLSGHTAFHEELEEAVARFKGTQEALVFSTGYMANLGTIPTIAGAGDLLILDRSNHASLFEGAFLSQAKLWIYRHRDVGQLQKLLQKASEGNFKKVWVITESLFSMDGDIAPLPDILRLCKEFGASLMIDEAHATGVLGATGRGALEYFSIDPEVVEIVMGTLSKALGSLGGYIAGSSTLIEYLKNKAKSFIYTTALPAHCCAAALKAIQIVESDGHLLRKLHGNIQYFREGLKALGFDVPEDSTPIIPILTGQDEMTMKAANFLESQGILAPGIRPPTVPESEGRIRFSLMAAHTKKHLDQAIEALGKSTEFLHIP